MHSPTSSSIIPKKHKSCLKMLLRSTLLLLIPCLAVALLVSNRWLIVSPYEIASPKLPDAFDGFTIAQLSDLHCTSFGRYHARLLDAVDRENPNIVVMTGDMVNHTEDDFSALLTFCRRITEKYPCYYISGNHEQGIPSQQKKVLMTGLAEAGVQILENDKVLLDQDGATIALYGGKYRSEVTVKQLRRTMGELEQDTYAILLAHNPLRFDVYAEWGADLILSGHVHGGVIRLPFIGALFSPEHKLFPAYSEGEYLSGGSKMIVSRGLGNNPFTLRLGSLPELVTVTLRTKTSE